MIPRPLAPQANETSLLRKAESDGADDETQVLPVSGDGPPGRHSPRARMPGEQPLQPPELLRARFVEWKYVGRGGGGHVFKARNAAGSWFAVKVPLVRTPDLTAGELLLSSKEMAVSRCLEEEVRQLKMVFRGEHLRDGHEYLLKPVECEILKSYKLSSFNSPSSYIISEWLDHGTLADFMRRGLREMRKSTPQQAHRQSAVIVAKLARALACLHTCDDPGEQCVHRDLKPSNVLFRDPEHEHPVLIDLGLSARIAVTTAEADERAGTMRYMSPEQAAFGDHIDDRSDIFALGVVLYECMTGQSPWPNAVLRDTNLLSEAITNFRPPPRYPQSVVSSVPRALADICTRAMQKDRENRYQTAAMMADELERWVARHSPNDAGSTSNSFATYAGWKRALRRSAMTRKFAAGIVAAVVVALTVAFWVLPPRQDAGGGAGNGTGLAGQGAPGANPLPTPRDVRKIEAARSKIREVESNVLPAPFTVGPATHGSLKEFYFAANPELERRLQTTVEIHEQRVNAADKTEHRVLTFITGPAGSGKSFFAARLKELLPTATEKVDLKDLYQKNWASVTEVQADLVAESPEGDKQIVLSELRALKNDEHLGLSALLSEFVERGKVFLIVDSLDEVHPNDNVKILEHLQDFVLNGSHPFLHVVVFGRPEAYWDYSRKMRHSSATKPSPEQLEFFQLQEPRLTTTGDLLVACWGHDVFQLRLRMTGSREMTFEEYESWDAAGYRRGADFAGVTFSGSSTEQGASSKINAHAHALLKTWSTQQPLIAACFSNLDMMNQLLGLTSAGGVFDRKYDDQELRAKLFDLRLVRGTLTHGRPSGERKNSVALTNLYLKLLQAVAWEKAGEIDSAGYFVVDPTETVSVEYQGQKLQAYVHQVLERSGFAVMNSQNDNQRRFRFEPAWVLGYLFEKAAAASP